MFCPVDEYFFCWGCKVKTKDSDVPKYIKSLKLSYLFENWRWTFELEFYEVVIVSRN